MINTKAYEYGSGSLLETGKMLGGWVKNSCKEHKNTSRQRKPFSDSGLTALS